MFKEIYYNYLGYTNKLAQIKRTKSKTDGWLSASSAGSCYKKQYYNIIKAIPTNPPSEEALSRMRLGTLMHKDFEDAMSLMIDTGNEQYDYYTEYPVKLKDLKVGGTLDMAIHDKSSNQLFVGDLKTIGSYPYKLRFGRDRMKNRSKVSSNYELQVCTYAIALSNELQLPNVIPMLVYYNKDTSRIKTVEIPFSFMDEAQQYWEDTRDIIDELGDDFNEIDANSMVGVPFSDWECGYCEFKDKCHG
jgi:hypothetical protein